ncbi:hypothetical protein HYV71_01445 [Candidatus Uhrbacteria bacterium]|nr:hypothetical protein [Candidatus Uhrbacteria bacterium]
MAIIFIGGIAGGIYYLYQQVRTPLFYDPITLITFQYPDGVIRASTESEEDQKAKIIFRGKESEKDATTPFLVTIRYEHGLRKVSSLLRYDIIDILADSVDKQFPKEHPKFEKIDERRFSLKSKKAGEITFTYLSRVGEQIKQRFLIVARDEDMALYITMQAREKDFDAINAKYFEKIISSIDFRLK